MTSRDINTYMVSSPYSDESPRSSASDKKNLIKAKGSKAALKKKLAIGIPIAVVVGAIVITGIVFLAYYLATLDAVAKDGFCMSGLSCSSNMVCSYGKCSCSNGTSWNSSSSYCVNISMNSTSIANSSSSNTTTNTTNISKIISIFSGSSYKTTSITTYAGTLSLSNPSDLYAVYTTQIMYLVMDFGNMALIFYDEYGNYLRYTSIQDGGYVTAYNGYIYVTTWSTSNGHVHKYDMTCAWITSYFVGNTYLNGLTYNAKSDYLYLCDQSNNMIRAFDKNLNYNASQSFSLSGVMDVDSYQGYLYIGTSANMIYIYNGNTLVTSYSGVCKSNYMYDLYVHSDSGYLLLPCHWDKKVYLWYTNGTQAFFTGLFINTAGNPRGVGIDAKGQLVVSMVSPNRIDIITLI